MPTATGLARPRAWLRSLIPMRSGTIEQTPDLGKKGHFQEKILNLVKFGQCKVFAIRRGSDTRIRYYLTNRLKLKSEQLLPRLKAHWRVETMHLHLKDLFQLRGCNSGRETMNNVHWELSYHVYLLFCQYQHQLRQ